MHYYIPSLRTATNAETAGWMDGSWVRAGGFGAIRGVTAKLLVWAAATLGRHPSKRYKAVQRSVAVVAA